MKLASVFIIILLFTTYVRGQTPPTTKIHLVQELFSGEKNKTFDQDNTASGIMMILSSKNPTFNYYTKGKFITASGNQEFLDDGNEVDSDFTYYKSSLEVGGNIYPISRKAKQPNLYLGVAGVMSYNYLALDSDEFTKIKSSYQTMSFGYVGTMGFEWQVLGRYAITAEISQYFETADLVEVSNFSLNTFSFSLGMGW